MVTDVSMTTECSNSNTARPSYSGDIMRAAVSVKNKLMLAKVEGERKRDLQCTKVDGTLQAIEAINSLSQFRLANEHLKTSF